VLAAKSEGKSDGKPEVIAVSVLEAKLEVKSEAEPD
jgi:hypothetical protein